MVQIIEESHNNKKVIIKIKYDDNNSQDKVIISQIEDLLKLQPNCQKCVHFYKEGSFGGYMASACKIHGNLEYVGHPFHDMDASKCKDYKPI